ncbi:hypothetical protein SapgrDRAFT_0980 [Saprospira grandis DSM 2844]|uniref:Uncharacterized protein n=1 Tax=Saprospira grandis DSM 2844 TaxID=694433 RepID=J0NYW5_9BACT|nr:hypothetical protein [Saprospira grandis]EJF52709.1 hypothetical protein SapgrDRAFT_0980 [Saprospira grandis DSM 2844]
MKNYLQFVLLLCPFMLWGQAYRELRVEQYQYNMEGDSMPIKKQVWRYGEAGELVGQEEYEYRKQPAGSLKSSFLYQYDEEAKLGQQQQLKYSVKGGQPQSQLLKTHYIKYGADEQLRSKQLYFDKTGELQREDSLTYNEKGQLLVEETFDYRGSTSHRSWRMKYNKAGKLKKKGRYVHWSTVKRGGKVVYKKERREWYKYKYNRKGQPKLMKGKSSSRRYKTVWKYDEQGRILFYQSHICKRFKNSPKPKKKGEEEQKEKKQPKYRYLSECHTKKYEKGQLVLEIEYDHGKVKERTAISYLQDSLKSELNYWVAGKLKREEKYYYDSLGQLEKQENYYYNSLGLLNYRLDIYYNSKEQILREEQWVREQKVRELRHQYDAKGRQQRTTLMLEDGRKFEKTYYFYKD